MTQSKMPQKFMVKLPEKQEKKTAERLLVCCMDFRICSEVALFAKGLTWQGDYDHFILAGASLGFCLPQYKHWRKTLIDHIKLGHKLHQIKQVVFIDHLDCGLYKGHHKEVVGNIQKEEQYHRRYLSQTCHVLKRKFKNIEFHGFIMYRNGEVLKIKIDPYIKRENAPSTQHVTLKSLINQKEEVSEEDQDKFLSNIQSG